MASVGFLVIIRFKFMSFFWLICDFRMKHAPPSFPSFAYLGSLQHKIVLLEPRTFHWCIALYAYSSMNFGYFSFLLLNPKEKHTHVNNLFVYATVGAASYFWYICWETRYSNVISFLIACVNMLAVILYMSVVCDEMSLSRVVDHFGILKYDISAV